MNILKKTFWTWDKAAHLLVCFLMVCALAFADMAVWHRDLAVATSMAIIATAILVIVKEVCDLFFRDYGTGKGFDGADLLADAIGIILGAVTVVVLTLWAP